MMEGTGERGARIEGSKRVSEDSMGLPFYVGRGERLEWSLAFHRNALLLGFYIFGQEFGSD